jgi:hypothetical protein
MTNPPLNHHQPHPNGLGCSNGYDLIGQIWASSMIDRYGARRVLTSKLFGGVCLLPRRLPKTLLQINQLTDLRSNGGPLAVPVTIPVGRTVSGISVGQ